MICFYSEALPVEGEKPALSGSVFNSDRRAIDRLAEYRPACCRRSLSAAPEIGKVSFKINVKVK